MARAKRKLPAKPAAFISPHHRGHFCPVIRYPNTKPPPPTIHTPQKPHGSVKRHRPTPEHKKTRCRSEHRRPLSFLRTTTVTSAPSSDTRTQSPRRRQYTPHKNLTARSNGTDRRPNTKKPAAAPNTAGRFHFFAPPRSLLPRHPIPEHKAPAADNTHPTKTSRLGQTAPTDARTQKTRCRSEHRRPFPLSLKKPQRCLNAIVQRQPPPAGAQHHLTQPNPNISGRRFTAFFALRCL